MKKTAYKNFIASLPKSYKVKFHSWLEYLPIGMKLTNPPPIVMVLGAKYEALEKHINKKGFHFADSTTWDAYVPKEYWLRALVKDVKNS